MKPHDGPKEINEMNSTTARVVAGIDDSADSRRAVSVAARQAELRGLPLRIVHASLSPGYSPPAEFGDPRARSRVDAVLAEAVAAAQLSAPGIEVTAEVVDGTDAAVLLAESEHAVLLVIGHRGLGAVTAVLTRAVGLQLAARTKCPLLIVRGPGNPAGPVIVGVEIPSSTSGDVLDFAFRQARLGGRPLVVAHAGYIPDQVFAGAPRDRDGSALVTGPYGDRVQGEVEGVHARYPEVNISIDVRFGAAAEQLIEAAADASFFVVGSPGAGGFRGLAHGSVAMAAAQHASCPVFVVPPVRARA